MAKRMNEFIYLHESEKEREKKGRSMVKKECVRCSGERKWGVGTYIWERKWEVGYVGYV